MKRAGIIIIFCILFSNCADKSNSTDTKFKAKTFPDQEGWNSTLTATTNGVITAIIEYGHMERYNKKKSVNFKNGVNVDFYDENGKHTSKLTSVKGSFDEMNNVVEAYENVVVVSDSGITLLTEKIWWDNNIKKVISDQFVTITTLENDTLYGIGFESDQTLTNWTLNEPRGKTDKGINLNINEKSKSDSTASGTQQ